MLRYVFVSVISGVLFGAAPAFGKRALRIGDAGDRPAEPGNAQRDQHFNQREAFVPSLARHGDVPA